MLANPCCCDCSFYRTGFEDSASLDDWTQYAGTFTQQEIFTDVNPVPPNDPNDSVQTYDSNALMLYDQELPSSSMRAWTLISLQDGSGVDDNTLAAAAHGTQCGLVIAAADDENYLYVEIESRFRFRIWKYASGESPELLAATDTDQTLNFGGTGFSQPWFYVSACYDGSRVRAYISVASSTGVGVDEDDFFRGSPGSGMSGPLVLEADGVSMSGKKAGLKTRAIVGGAGLRVNFLNFNLTKNVDAGGFPENCMLCYCGPEHLRSSSQLSTIDTTNVYEVISGTWTQSGGSLITTTGGLILTRWPLIPVGRSMMRLFPLNLVSNTGDWIRYIVDCIDEDNYHAFEFTWTNGAALAEVGDIKIIRRESGSETVLFSRTDNLYLAGGGIGMGGTSGSVNGPVSWVNINSNMLWCEYGGRDVPVPFGGSGQFVYPWPWARITPLGGRRAGYQVSSGGQTSTNGAPRLLQIADGHYAARCLESAPSIRASVRVSGPWIGGTPDGVCTNVPDEYSVEITGNGVYNGTYICAFDGTAWRSSGGAVTVVFGDVDGYCYVTDGSGQYRGSLPAFFTACDTLVELECLPNGDSPGSPATTGAKAYVTAL